MSVRKGLDLRAFNLAVAEEVKRRIAEGGSIKAAWEKGSRCPSCGASLELVKASEGGRIEEPYFPTHPIRNAPLPRRSRPANFLACSGCEHCEEVR